MLPFTREQFIGVFASYNSAIWPLQFVVYAAGFLAVLLLCRPGRRSDRAIAAILAAMWLWTGAVYHGLFFAPVNPAAWLFAALFLAEGLLLVTAGVLRSSLRFGPRRDAATVVGAAFLVYAGVLYPLVGVAAGHRYPEAPVFGVTPCPVTIFTFGFLLMTQRRPPWWLLPVPLVWSLIGGSAAFLLGIPQDWPLLVSGVIATLLIVLGRVARRPVGDADMRRR